MIRALPAPPGRRRPRAAPLLSPALLGVIAALLALLAPAAALAEPELVARASAAEVEVGEPFTVELKALVEQGEPIPSDPVLRPPAGISITGGPSLSSQTMAQFGPGGSSVRTGVGATWQLSAEKAGSFVIPAPSIRWGGKSLRANPISVTVVPATGRPRRPQNPFLLPGGPMGSFPWPFGGPGQGPFGGPGQSRSDELDEELDTGASELAMAEAPDPTVFLRAVVDKTSAVVGEQVTLTFYLYYRENLEMGERHEAPLADFRRVPLLKNPGTDAPVHARVGGRRFEVRLLDKIALFPLKAGELHTGEMTARITGRRIGARAIRQSNDVVIRVTEPPAAGRPPGYSMGDVGKFTLSAAVQPRKVDQGGSTAVTVRIEGSGNFPPSLRVPARTGIEWLDPEKRESIEPRAGVVAGWKTFGYVVRIKESGAVDLGTIELSYWSPEERRYVVEKAELGMVEVTPVTPPSGRSASGPAPAPSHEVAPRDPLAAMPAPRSALGAYAAAPPPPLEGAPLWILLGAPPLLVSVAGAGGRAIRRTRERRAAGAASPARLTAVAQREAEEAAARGDVKETAAAVERAVHRAIEAATGLRSRGVLLDDLPGELDRRGVPRPLAERALEVLGACEVIRFDPGASATAATDLAGRARDLTTELARGKPA